MRVLVSSLAADSTPASAAVGLDVVRCVTRAEPNSWFQFDLSPRRVAVRPSAYSLRHYSSWDVEAVRNWVFQGSVDGATWTTLRAHKEDTTLNGKGAAATWALQDVPEQGYFSHFRVFQTGPNSNKHFYLPISGFELFGTVILPKGPLPHLFHWTY